jgi:hypothetical protein
VDVSTVPASEVYAHEQEVSMRDNPFADVEPRRGDPPGSIPGTGLGRQVGSVDAHPGAAGRGWSSAQVGADRLFAAVAGMVVLVGLAVWLVTTVLG